MKVCSSTFFYEWHHWLLDFIGNIRNLKNETLPSAVLWGCPLILWREAVFIKLVRSTDKYITGYFARAKLEWIGRKPGIKSNHRWRKKPVTSRTVYLFPEMSRITLKRLEVSFTYDWHKCLSYKYTQRFAIHPKLLIPYHHGRWVHSKGWKDDSGCASTRKRLFKRWR